MKLIVGLGNPSAEYANTYHNAGFLALDAIAKKAGVEFSKKECQSITSHIFYEGEKIVLCKPQTYMNLSGIAVQEMLSKYKLPLSDLLVVYDDIDIPLGNLRIRADGSAGTHNGMRNILFCVGSGEFARVRIGIGKPDTAIKLADYVLSKISKDALMKLNNAFENAIQACLEFAIGGDIATLSQKYNIS